MLFILSLSPVPRFFLKFITFSYSCTVTSEDVGCKHTKRQVNTVKFLDHALSLCNVCIRCLFSFPFETEMK